MGVPKFYRWISQRYPCINQIIKENEVVPIDHLYLDLNGIIHSSSHPDGAICLGFDEGRVFQIIANYINHIINLIKPRKTVFLAVDGVAPRAKMTQQRARRFVGPKEVADEVRRRKEKGQNIDESSIFDYNAISPGTEFMTRLHEFFKKYIADQVSTDPIWRRVDIIYSGHDVPGEGEQKIREYMSYKRSLPDYLPNERHCMYGMDADLIFLGLATHEPNICILRENVYTVKSPNPQDIPFCLVHLSLLREYIGLEFKDLESEISFPFDLERIIDDWIFMGYLLGNDFIPNLPNMHIHAESFNFLWDTYHVVLPKLDGYINEFGKLNLERFHVFITELSLFDKQWFAEMQADQRWMHGKHGAKMARELQRLGKQPSNLPPESPVKTMAGSNLEVEPKSLPDPEGSIVELFSDGTDVLLGPTENADGKLDVRTSKASMDESPPKVANLEELEEDLTDGDDAESDDLSDAESSAKDEDSSGDEEEEEETELSDEDWSDHRMHHVISPSPKEGNESEEDEDSIAYRMNRQDYYLQKLKIDIRGTSKCPNKDFIESALLSICREYVKTIQWVLDYYFKSVVDWKHYYPYHYAPFVSDLPIFTKRFLKDGVDYEKRNDWADFAPDTKPLLPFEQQMFIMPTASYKILPQPYRCLFAADSPVSEFFPEKFETDINGKLADWEAVVLIPFIDEGKMLAAMAPLTPHLSPEDASRNVHRLHSVLLVKDREKLDFSDASHRPTFGDLVTSEFNGEFYRSHVLRDPDQCLKVYCELQRRVDPAYPSLYRIPFEFTIERVGVTTFSFPSKSRSILLTANHPLGRNNMDYDPVTLKQVAKSFLGRPVYTGWPYSRLVVPVAVMDEKQIWWADMSRGKTQVVDRTNLRNQPDQPYWSSIRWLQSQSDWCVMRLRDRCAIKLAGEQPRAALLCLPATDSLFCLSTSASDPSHVSIHRFCLQPENLSKMINKSRNLRQRNYGVEGIKTTGVNKQSLRYDANVSISLSSEATLEILDLTMVDLTTNVALDRSLFDVFPRGSNVIIFDRPSSSMFGRAGEILAITPSNLLTIKLHPEVPLSKNPGRILKKAIAADDRSYLTLQQMSRKLSLTQHSIQRIVGDFMVRIPPPPADDAPNSSVRRVTDRPSDDRRNFANIGLSLCLHDDRAFLSDLEVLRSKNILLVVSLQMVDHAYFCRRRRQLPLPLEQPHKNVGVNLLSLNPSASASTLRIQVIGWSRYSSSQRCWLFSQRTVDAIAKYNKLFPEVINFIGQRNIQHKPPEMGAICTNNTFERYTALRAFLRTDVKANRTVTDVGAALLDEEGLRLIQTDLLPSVSSSQSSSEIDPVDVAPTAVFAVLPEGGRVIPQSYQRWLRNSGKLLDKFDLLDRVVYVGPRHEIFGLGGFIIGVYPILGEETIEVMFDRTFDGAVSIRGSAQLCMVVPAAHLLLHPHSMSAELSLSNAVKKHLSKENVKLEAGAVKHLKAAPSDSLLPPQWLELPSDKFPSGSTAPLASSPSPSKMAPKRQTTIMNKTSQQKSVGRPATNNNNNSNHFSATFSGFGQKKNNNRPNQANKQPLGSQETRHPQTGLSNHSKISHEHLTAAVNAHIVPQPVPPPMGVGFVEHPPQPPSAPPPQDWQIAGQSTIVDGGLLCFPSSPFPPAPMVPPQLVVPVAPLPDWLQPYWYSDGSIGFFDANNGNFYTAADLEHLYWQPPGASFQPDQQQPEVQQWPLRQDDSAPSDFFGHIFFFHNLYYLAMAPSLLEGLVLVHLSSRIPWWYLPSVPPIQPPAFKAPINTRSLDPCAFVPNQVKQAAMRNKRR
ncbi:hypothetical protein Aperf_G00000098663 [Anoplocephala perfoliata]